MEDRSHLELNRLAQRCRTTMQQTEDTLRQQYDGPAILEAIRQTEAIYGELSELFDPAVVEQRNIGLEQTRQRFAPEFLEQGRELNQGTWVNLRSAIRHAERTNEALGRCVRGFEQNIGFENIHREFEAAFSEIAETLHYSFLITLPDNEQIARHI